MKLNKKGFTLVELLAVIVILALLIVVVANTALPAMNNAKKSTLETYAKRVVEQAKTLHTSAEITATNKCTTTSGVTTCTFTALSDIMGDDVSDDYSLAENFVISKSGGKYNITGKITGSGYTTTVSTTDGKVAYSTN